MRAWSHDMVSQQPDNLEQDPLKPTVPKNVQKSWGALRDTGAVENPVTDRETDRETDRRTERWTGGPSAVNNPTNCFLSCSDF